jgi:hypothetical protein
MLERADGKLAAWPVLISIEETRHERPRSMAAKSPSLRTSPRAAKQGDIGILGGRKARN